MNLLLISVDSLRLDFAPGVSAAVHTPRFSALTRDFHLCQHCFSVSSATRPVHTSLFTGLYPFEHGIEGQHSPAMRQGVTDLFDLCRRAGYATGAFSEAPDIFTGLSYADHIAPLPTNEQLTGWLQRREPTILFIHYWSVHPPYGAKDGLAFGEVGRLLTAGRIDVVQARYRAAIEQLFERHIAQLLAALDLNTWAVFIISDHGQSWRADEPYHGQTLCNDVLRVPLYYRLPSEEPVGCDLISLVDLFPTFLSLLELDHSYSGFARDLRSPSPPEYYLAEIDPGPTGQYGRQWSLFNASAKFTCDQATQRETLVETFSERPLPALDTRSYHHAYTALRATSSYVQAELDQTTDCALLHQRLRALGYMD
ncbi:MAG: sulfatase-like hydrolase/transferase [Gemmatimonadota bacterium]|nr:sulfatase-like hydrolase/transferase [Gemmatimonadota bacterium]